MNPLAIGAGVVGAFGSLFGGKKKSPNYTGIAQQANDENNSAQDVFNQNLKASQNYLNNQSGQLNNWQNVLAAANAQNKGLNALEQRAATQGALATFGGGVRQGGAVAGVADRLAAGENARWQQALTNAQTGAQMDNDLMQEQILNNLNMQETGREANLLRALENTQNMQQARVGKSEFNASQPSAFEHFLGGASTGLSMGSKIGGALRG